MCQVVTIVSCYKPLAAFPDYDHGKTDTGNYRYNIAGKFNPDYIQYLDPNVIKIPCGKCLGCRLDKARSWADRMILELESNDGKGIFLTLTYNNDNVPIATDEDGMIYGYSLCKRDVQLFFKRLRKHFSSVRIRYYLTGEYGGKTHRPHYHAIVFGLSMDNFSDCRKIGMNELKQDYYTSKELENIWNNGFILLSPVTYRTCSYVARYCMKKAFIDDTDDIREKEFAIMSRNPGIGYYYLKDNPWVFDTKHSYISDLNGSVQVSIPKYFIDKLKVDNKELYDKLDLGSRKSLLQDQSLIEFSNTDLSYVEYLESQENLLINKTKILFNRREEFNDET